MLRGLNRGSLNAALIALTLIPSSNDSCGVMWPMQPLRPPWMVRVTKVPRRSWNMSGKSAYDSFGFFRSKSRCSMVFRAASRRYLPSLPVNLSLSVMSPSFFPPSPDKILEESAWASDCVIRLPVCALSIFIWNISVNNSNVPTKITRQKIRQMFINFIITCTWLDTMNYNRTSIEVVLGIWYWVLV